MYNEQIINQQLSVTEEELLETEVYVLVNAPLRVLYGYYIIGQAEVREAHVARGEAECYMMLRELPRGQYYP